MLRLGRARGTSLTGQHIVVDCKLCDARTDSPVIHQSMCCVFAMPDLQETEQEDPANSKLPPWGHLKGPDLQSN